MNITIKRAETGAGIPARNRDETQDDVPVRKFSIVFAGKRSRVTAEPIREEDGEVVDYKDVTIRGYLSTWKETTPKDRDGEWVLKGAFKSAIPAFMKNPVLLLDHANTTDAVAGRFTKMVEDERGLYVEAVISNAPGLKDVRFHIAEGNLKTMSIGGAFRFDADDRGIKEVQLYEGSLTPVPSNPDAVFTVQSLSPEGKRFMKGGGTLAGLKSVEPKAIDLGSKPFSVAEQGEPPTFYPKVFISEEAADSLAEFLRKQKIEPGASFKLESTALFRALSDATDERGERHRRICLDIVSLDSIDGKQVKSAKGCGPKDDEDEKGAKVHPGADESKDEFISRCMGALKDEFGDTDQRLAVCNRYWEGGPKD